MQEANESKVPVLDIRNVKVAYGPLTAIENVSFQIYPGETIGLIGLNGAGKTSLIKCVIGLRDQDEGNISLFGHPSTDKQVRRAMAFLPERFEPPWFLSGMEFLAFSLELYGRKFDRAAMIEAAQRLALDPRALDRRVQTYSKGMRQKLGLMGTIMTGCELLILDEPMSGLDPKARALVKDMLAGCRREGRTVFLSSHILADMDEICDRIALLHNSSLMYLGTPHNLKAITGTDHLERAFLHFIENRKAA